MRDTLKKRDIASSIAFEEGISAGAAERIVCAMLRQVAENLAAGKAVGLHGVGTLTPKASLKRTGTDPQGRPWSKPASVRVCFKPAAALLRRLEVTG